MTPRQKASLVVCSTCRFSKENRLDADGRSGGALFFEQLVAAHAHHACRDRLALQQMACLFACTDHCTVFLRDEGRMGYVLGRFTPAETDATALLDYIALYLDSAAGIVPYGQWPQGVKGHFLVRVPHSDSPLISTPQNEGTE